MLVAGRLGPSAYWYLARATGVVALVLLTVSVILGILGAVRFSAGPRWPRFAIDSLHRDTSLLVIALIVIHVITSVLDGFAPISLIDGEPRSAETSPIFKTVHSGEGTLGEEDVFWRADGSAIPVEYRAHPIRQEGKTLGAVVTFVDVTPRRRAETEMRLRDRVSSCRVRVQLSPNV